MPVVPYSSPRVQPQGYSGLQRINVPRGAFGETIVQSGQNAADTAGAIAQRIKVESDIAAIKGQANRLRQDINQQLYLADDGYFNRRGRDAVDQYGSTEAALRALAKKHGSQMNPGFQQNKFREVSEGLISDDLEDMARHASRERKSWLDAEDQDLIRQAVEDGGLRVEDNAVQVQQIRGAISNLAARNGWTEDEAERNFDEAVNTMHTTALQRVITERPETARSYFDQHRDEIHGAVAIDVMQTVMAALPGDERVEFLQSVAENPPAKMRPDMHQKAVKVLEARLKRDARILAMAEEDEREDRARAAAKQLSNLEIAVARGEAGEDDIEAAWAKGLITSPEKRTRLLLQLGEDRRRVQQERMNAERVYAHMMSGTPLDFQSADDRKLVDGWFQQSGIQPFTPEGNAQLAFSVARLQVVPAEVQSAIRGLLRSGQTRQAVAAAELVADIVDSAPMVVDQLGTTEKAIGLNVSSMVKAGVPADKAVELARHNAYQLSSSEREVLAGRYRETRTKNPAALTDYIDDDIDTLFSAQPDATDLMIGEFDQLTEQYFFRTGDEQVARDAAWADLQRVWSVTDINGRRELMKYPPPVTRDMLLTELEQAGIATEGVRVVADAETARGGSYALLRVTDGVPAPILNDQNLPARWTPERIRTESMEKAIEFAKQARKTRDQPPKFSAGDFAQ